MKVLIVGSGLAGAVAARLFFDRGHQVTVFETRGHLGGNCHDSPRNGIMVHNYGPHGFHTNNEEVWTFVNRFSSFHPTELKVMANTQFGVIPVPFNDISAEIVGDRTPDEIRDLIFIDYSEKHWGTTWDKLPASIRSRVAQRRVGTDCRYHVDRWQGTPVAGYTTMFEAILEGIPVKLNCEPDEWRKYAHDHLVYTGSLDDFYCGSFGLLEYRSLDFEYLIAPKRDIFQLNECNKVNSWTRSVDHSHWLDQEVQTTVISREYPCEWNGENVRFYPKPFGANPDRFQKYWECAKNEPTVTFLGRLATYKYLDMDDTIAQVLNKLSALKI